MLLDPEVVGARDVEISGRHACHRIRTRAEGLFRMRLNGSPSIVAVDC
jgi:hypothetical protein